MKIYNSLSRKIEEFTPINPPVVGMYTCGPTVYSYAHIGNFRTYTTADLFHRALIANHFKVNYYMNITDVGHLTGDNLGDADTGEDRLEVAAARESKSAWDIAKFYESAFLKDYHLINLLPPSAFVRVTDHIQEQIDLVKKLEDKGFAYKISDGIYFDTSKFPDYGKLSTLDQIKEGARVEVNEEKRNPRDFALWKFSPAGEKRQMEWDSPWGVGFPGWHIECSAMSMKYLGESYDVHFGGEDLRSTHHPNEIAQSEAASGKKFVKYWVHSAFILVDKKRMGKSLGNAYTISDIVSRGYDALALKYFYFTGHYQTQINFTWETLEGANQSLKRLRNFVQENDPAQGQVNEKAYADFLEAINDNLNTARALAIIWDLLKEKEITNADKSATLVACDQVLGFNLDAKPAAEVAIPQEVQDLLTKREEARKAKNWPASDQLRAEIESHGYTIKDTDKGPKLLPKT